MCGRIDGHLGIELERAQIVALTQPVVVPNLDTRDECGCGGKTESPRLLSGRSTSPTKRRFSSFMRVVCLPLSP
jgi:hypothetical protein